MINEKDLNQSLPFNDELIPSGLDELIFKFKEKYPNKLVRLGINNNYSSLDEEIKGYQESKDLFYKMRDYGIHVVDIDFVVAKVNHINTTLTLTDKIEGVSLFNIRNVSKEEKEKIEKFFENIALYIADPKNNILWYDIGLDQIVFGHKYGEGYDRDQVYIVDIDNYFDNSQNVIQRTIMRVINMMRIMKYNNPDVFDFSKTVNILRNILPYSVPLSV